ncbi:hypothetical protein D3C87_485530 [compost metagenome]
MKTMGKETMGKETGDKPTVDKAEDKAKKTDELYTFSVFIDAPHDRVWMAIKDQVEHPKRDPKQLKGVQVIERTRNTLIRDLKPKRGRAIRETITFFPNKKALRTEMNRGPYASISQEVTKEKGRTKLTVSFLPRRTTRWILKLKQWVKRKPLELDDLMNLAKLPTPAGKTK